MDGKTGARVVFGENPRDGEEMRQLPQKENGEQGKRNSIDFAASRRPTHHRRRSAWKSSD